MLIALFNVLDLLLRVASYIIIAQAIISWLVAFNVINTTNDFVRSFLARSIDHRAALPADPAHPADFGGIDFSPIVVLLLIYIARILLAGVASDFAA
jgi:YggT family protein